MVIRDPGPQWPVAEFLVNATNAGLICVNGSPVSILNDNTMLNGAKKSLVIVVDDDTDVRESLRFLLECEGLNVEDFASGPQLIAAGWPPRAGCMVLDIHMPGMSGLDVLDRLNQAKSDLPVIIITGQTSTASRERAIAAGALEVLDKPLNDVRLVELVRKVLGLD